MYKSYQLTSAFGLPKTTSHSSFTDFPVLTLTLLRPASTTGSLPAAHDDQRPEFLSPELTILNRVIIIHPDKTKQIYKQ